MENGTAEETVEEQTESTSQGVGFAGKLFIVWRGALINTSHMPIIQVDQGEGALNFIMDTAGKALSVYIKNNPQIAKLIADAPDVKKERDGKVFFEKEDTLINCLEILHGIIITNLMRDDVLVMDLDGVLSTFARRSDVEGGKSALMV